MTTTSNTTSSNTIIPEIPSIINNIINIDKPGHLLWLINNQLSGITRSNNATTSNTTTSNNTTTNIKLNNNIDMMNQSITGMSSFNLINCTFDGNFKKILNLNLNIDNYLINNVDINSVVKNLSFENYKCKFLINTNNGLITNCIFNNSRCILGGLVNNNLNKIESCKVNNIKLINNFTNTDNNNNIGVLAIINSGNINNCQANNVTIDGNNSYCGGIVGKLANGTISNCSIENLNYSTNLPTAIGGICGLVESGTINGCTIKINNINKNTGIIVGKSLNLNTINIYCITFKTNKNEPENSRVDLKYNREEENSKRKEGGTTRAGTTRAGTTRAGTTRAGTTRAGTTTTQQNKQSPLKLVYINEGTTTIVLKNIYNTNSNNKMSKWDYDGIIFDDVPCTITVPKITLKKPIDVSSIDKLKNYLKETIKKYSTLDINIRTETKDSTLYVYFEDNINTPTSLTVNASTAIGRTAEYFQATTDNTKLTDVVYIYNTKDSVAVMDALNQISVDPVDIVALGVIIPDDSNKLIIFLILFGIFSLLIILIYKNLF
jgi:hypothetical protein